MKTIKSKALLLITLLFIICFMGCKNQGHKKEERLLKKERLEAEKAASDLSMAVKVTDETGRNGKEMYMQYKANVLPRLANDSVALMNFKIKITGKRKRVPLIYRSKIKRLEGQITELENRLCNYKLKDKANWDDFEVLFNDDMKRMEQTLDHLIRR